MVFHDPGDGARCQADPELAEFTLDAPVTPSRVLGGQTQNEGGRLVVDGRTSRWAMGIRPASGHQPAAPGQQGGGRHAEGAPRRTRKQATEDGQQGTIGRLVSGTPHLASEDRHFMAQREQLDLLGLFVPKEQEDQLEQMTDSQVAEGPKLPPRPVPSYRADGSRADRSSAQSPWCWG